jgi:hypothetical protein
MPVVKWEEVESAANEAFSVLIGQPELEWAKHAWEILTHAGLATWKDEIEVPIIYLRVLVLGGVFQDWYCVACDDYPAYDYSAWGSSFDFDSFTLGRLHGLWIDEENALEWIAEDEAFDVLVESRRAEVVDAITEGFGGTNGLFESLWKVTFGAEISEDSEAWIASNRNMRAYSWIEEGCSRVGP